MGLALTGKVCGAEGGRLAVQGQGSGSVGVLVVGEHVCQWLGPHSNAR